jgi:putative membrane protein
MIDRAAWRSVQAFSKGLVAKELDLHVEGRELVPSSGPVILAARHYHHLYDGCAVIATIPRQVQVMVGLDWIERPFALKGMQTACRSAGWPVVFRNTDEVDRAVWLPVLRSALAESQAILRAGKLLLVFPEGYPTIDPHGSPKQRDDEFLPFHPGFARIAADAWKTGTSAVIVPVGFHYAKASKWKVTMRFGEPIDATESTSADRLTALVEQQVIALSR